jgi:hypothetical protein
MGKELTVGTPVSKSTGLQPGWVEVECSLCNEPMHCQERNLKPKISGNEMVLICFDCIGKLESEL